MEQRSRVIFYNVHSWTGVLCSILLFVVAFSGTVALFVDELTQWERPAHRIDYNAEQPLDLDRLLAPIFDRADVKTDDIVFLQFPTAYQPTLLAHWHDALTGEDNEAYINPVTGEILPEESEDFTALLREVHTDLLLPKPWGRYLVGATGLVMLLSLVTGVIVHHKLFKELFTFRFERKRRTLWTDLHKIVGIWVLPFHAMIAFTGMFLGLGALLFMVAAFSAFDGDVDKAAAAVLGETAVAVGEPLGRYSMNDAYRQYQRDRPENTPHYMIIEAFGDHNEVISVEGGNTGALVRTVGIKYRSRDGEVVKVNDQISDSKGPFVRTFFAFTPLHYALYGGLLLKVVYFVLGLGTCLMMVTGTLIWIERRAQRRRYYPWLSALTIGVCMGLPIATLATFWANKLLPGYSEWPQRYETIMVVFLVVWALCLAWVFSVRVQPRAIKHLFALMSALFLGVPLVNIVATGYYPWQALLSNQLPVLVVDIIGLVGALVMGWVSYRLPEKAPSKSNKPPAELAQTPVVVDQFESPKAINP